MIGQDDITTRRRPRRPVAPRPDAAALADRRRAAMRARAGRIRRSVAGISLGLFTAAFLGIYVQLASGHDPALSGSRAAKLAAARSEASSSAGGSTESSASSAESGSSSSPSTSGGESSSSASSPTEASQGTASSGGESSGGSTPSEATESSSPSAVTTSQS